MSWTWLCLGIDSQNPLQSPIGYIFYSLLFIYSVFVEIVQLFAYIHTAEVVLCWSRMGTTAKILHNH